MTGRFTELLISSKDYQRLVPTRFLEQILVGGGLCRCPRLLMDGAAAACCSLFVLCCVSRACSYLPSPANTTGTTPTYNNHNQSTNCKKKKGCDNGRKHSSRAMAWSAYRGSLGSCHYNDMLLCICDATGRIWRHQSLVWSI